MPGVFKVTIKGVNTVASMTKKISAYIPDVMAKELEEWADRDGRSISSLIGFVLEVAIRQERERVERMTTSQDKSQGKPLS